MFKAILATLYIGLFILTGNGLVIAFKSSM